MVIHKNEKEILVTDALETEAALYFSLHSFEIVRCLAARILVCIKS